uniref:Uncharacterized protein n=1 Tax=Ammonifex degensii TaxID=42838 RepID=A0A7C1FEG1_9THEO
MLGTFVFLKRERPSQSNILFLHAPAPQVELLPLYVATASGVFGATGVEVRFIYAGDNHHPRLRGKILRVLKLEEIIYARAFTGTREKAVLTLTQQPNAALLGRQPSFFWNGLKQKTIVTPEPTSAVTALFEELLRQNGVYPTARQCFL